MSPERKQGRRFTGSRAEAIALGPYPTWENWRHVLYTYLEEKNILLKNGCELALKEFYIIRRRYQKGEISPSALREVNHDFLEKFSTIIESEGNITTAFKFITGKTSLTKEELASRKR